MMRILVTGANGFVGRAVATKLARDGHQVSGAARSSQHTLPVAVVHVHAPDLAADADWRHALAGVDAVVHCAARVHVMAETTAEPLDAFRRVNVDGTVALARQAVAAGVRRFVFISSIGVNGAQTNGRPFTADDPPAPHSPYARSKHEAEIALRQLADETGIEVVIIRPPLVFGPGAPGNFERLMHALYRGVPLPLGAIHNRRSLVAIGNLVDLIAVVLGHPAAGNQTLLVSDGEDISTTQLLQRTAVALGRPGRLLPVPALLVEKTAKLLGKSDLATRLVASLEVDISSTRRLLGWSPPIRLGDALSDAARDFLMHRRSL